MKKISFIALLLCTFINYSQKKYYNKISIETAFGLNLALSPNSRVNYEASDFSSFKHFDVGFRYMINHHYGARISYSYDRFQWEGSSLAINYNRVGFEGILNLSDLLDFPIKRERNFQLQIHTGVGITFAKPKRDFKSEKIGNLIFGITPIFKLSNRLAFKSDISYITNLRQHYDYGGTLVNKDGQSVTGGFVNLTFGLVYIIGENRFHADWY